MVSERDKNRRSGKHLSLIRRRFRRVCCQVKVGEHFTETFRELVIIGDTLPECV